MKLAWGKSECPTLPFILQDCPLSQYSLFIARGLHGLIWTVFYHVTRETEIIKETIKAVLTKMSAAFDLHFTHLLQIWFMEKTEIIILPENLNTFNLA